MSHHQQRKTRETSQRSGAQAQPQPQPQGGQPQGGQPAGGLPHHHQAPHQHPPQAIAGPSREVHEFMGIYNPNPLAFLNEMAVRGPYPDTVTIKDLTPRQPVRIEEIRKVQKKSGRMGVVFDISGYRSIWCPEAVRQVLLRDDKYWMYLSNEISGQRLFVMNNGGKFEFADMSSISSAGGGHGSSHQQPRPPQPPPPPPPPSAAAAAQHNQDLNAILNDIML